MPQSLVKNYLHIVFSIKNRVPLIKSEIEKDLYAYLGGICHNLNCSPIKIGGYKDHVHLLVLLSKKTTLIQLMVSLKSYSSKWIKTQGEPYKNFYWQKGYGAFSVNPTEIKTVMLYIDNQKEHHQERLFKKSTWLF